MTCLFGNNNCSNDINQVWQKMQMMKTDFRLESFIMNCFLFNVFYLFLVSCAIRTQAIKSLHRSLFFIICEFVMISWEKYFLIYFPELLIRWFPSPRRPDNPGNSVLPCYLYPWFRNGKSRIMPFPRVCVRSKHIRRG